MKDKADDIKVAILSLYSTLNAGDADAFVQYMESGGYTEFSEDGGTLFKIDEKYVRPVFSTGLKADFEIHELQVNVFKKRRLSQAIGLEGSSFLISQLRKACYACR